MSLRLPGLGSRHSTPSPALRFLLGSVLSAALSLGVLLGAGAEEDWRVVTPPGAAEATKPAPGAAAPAPRSQLSAAQGLVVACGEAARPAGAPFKSTMAQVAALWDADARIYESVAPIPAHCRPGGCVFYNQQAMAKLLGRLMKVENASVRPMLYAIMAHELGHLMHHDFASGRLALSSVRRELEADQFAGYTLSRLNLRAENLADYYRLTGDDFSGGTASHGDSAQRAAAFMAGWRRGEMGLSEQSTIGVGGTDHP